MIARLSPLARQISLAVLLLATPLFAPPSFAVEPQEILADPVLEARARALSEGLRCLVCRNQSIDDSNAELARDIRVLLRERMTAGDTDEQAVAYLVNRYGEYILLKPPFDTATLALWLGPAVLLIAALLGFRAMIGNAAKPHDAGEDLTDEDRALIAQALAAKDAQ